MSKKAQSALMQKHGIKIILGVAILSLAVGLTSWKVYNPQSTALSSRAGFEEQPPHWAHSGAPFKVPFLNSSSRTWSKPLGQMIEKWQKTPAVIFATIPGKSSDPCYMYPEMMNFCTTNDPDTFIAQGWLLYWTNTGHIVSYSFMLNDASLNNPDSIYSTDAWRNKYLCLYMGWGIGGEISYNPQPDPNTCMNSYTDWGDEVNQQQPLRQDLDALKSLYHSHNDDTSSSGVARITAFTKELTPKTDRGELVKSYDNGQEQLYKLDLGNGYTRLNYVMNKPIEDSKKK
jgi:hypothetical protein